MAKRFTAEFSDLNGTDYRLDFYDSEYTGDVGTLTLGVPGFSLQWDGAAENTHEVIVPSGCSIPIYSQTTAEEDWIEDIQTGQESRHRVEIWKGTGAAERMFWSGILLCDLTLEDELPSLVTLEATDDLGLLNSVLFKANPSAEYTDTTHLVDIFCRCLSKLRHVEAWGSTTNFLHVIDYVQHEDMDGAPYTRKIIINTEKLRNVDDDGNPQYYTCAEVLTNMLTNIQCKLVQYDGHFWVYPPGGMGAGFISRAYYKTGDNGNVTDVRTWFSNIPSTTTFALGNLVTTANRQKLTGWQFAQLPSLSEVIYRHDYEGHAYDWNSLVPSTNFANSFWFANNAPTLEEDDVVSLTFSYYLSFPGYGSSVGSRGRRIRIAFKYRHGTIYAKRFGNVMTDAAGNVVTNIYSTSGQNAECFAYEYQAPGWSTTTSNEVQEFTAVFDRYTGANLQGTTTITFPAITGTPGVTSVGYFTLTTLDEDGNEDTNGPTYAVAGLTSIYQMRGSATYDGDVITYRRQNQDTAAREALELPDAILADKVGENSNPNSGLWLINDGGTYVKPTEGWSNTKHSGVSTTICDLAALDVLSMRLTPMKMANGTFEADRYGPLFSVQGLDEGSAYWIPMRLTMDAESVQYSGEWVEYQMDTTTGTTQEDNGGVLPGSAGMPTIGPRRTRVTLGTLAEALSSQTQRLASEVHGIVQEQADSAVDFGARLRDIETDGKQSALELVQLGDVNTSTLTEGDVLEWDATAEEWVNAQPSGGSGSDNSLSEVDQTLAADRDIDLDGNVLNVVDGSTTRLTISNADGVQVFGDFKVDSGAVAGASIKLEEADLLGDNYIELKAPISVTADTTLTLPDGAGTSGQVLSTNGTGTLSWVTRIGDTNPLTKGALTIERVTAGNVPRLYIKGEDNLAGVFLKAKESISTDVTFELPDVDGDDGDILTTDGAGVMAFEKPKSYHIIASSFYAADGNGDYIPIGGTLSETTSSNYYTIWTAPCAGRVVKATAIVSSTSAGASTLTVRKYPIPQTFASASHTFTSTLTTGTFTFGASATFAAGDRLQFRFDPTGRPNGTQISILLELTHE